jgi:hypothetical protein
MHTTKEIFRRHNGTDHVQRSLYLVYRSFVAEAPLLGGTTPHLI